jgi:predicted acyltransferase
MADATRTTTSRRPAPGGRTATSRPSGGRAPSRAARVRAPIRTARWDGLDVARGLTVATAAVLVAAGVLAPTPLGPATWVGLGPVDLVPGLFLVLAGAGLGWTRDTGRIWDAARWRRRAAVLIPLGAAVAFVRAGGDPAAVGLEELLRLLAATALATLVLRWRTAVVAPVTVLLALLPGALVTGEPTGRLIRTVEPDAAWVVERALGLPTGGVPLASLPGAVALVLVGAALGTWAHRRPPGPATAGALSTVGLWCLAATVVVGQVLGPTPRVLDLPVVLGVVGVASLLLGGGHLLAAGGGGASLGALGRTALPVVWVGAAALALLPTTSLLALPVTAALTAGGVVAAGALAAGRRLDATGWRLRA